MRVHFWALLIGGLILLSGLVGLANEIYGFNIDVPWLPVIVILIEIWMLSKAIERR